MTTATDRLIDPIAHFIGARLQHPNPGVNGQCNPWVSTIRVDQSKEKFWNVRVYCDLADPGLVRRYWDWLKSRQARQAAGEQVYTRMRAGLIAMLENNVDPPLDFFVWCIKRDAVHYRQVYMDMVALRPDLTGQVCGQANYTELLQSSVAEVEAALGINADDLDYTYQKFHVADAAELQELLRVVYAPTTKDLIDLRD